MDDGLSGDALKARVASDIGRPKAPAYTLPLANAIQAARDAVAGKPCDGHKRSKAFRLLLLGASDDIVAEALQTSTKASGYWRKQLSWVAPAGAAKSPRARAKASLDWKEKRTAPPLRRKRRSIWEYVIDALSDGDEGLAEITLLAQEELGPEITPEAVRTVYMALVSAKLALEGYVDRTQGNRIAQALMAYRGNQEAAAECGASISIVAGIRTALRRIDAKRVPLDPTSHLQSSEDLEAMVGVPPVGEPVPWAPPPPRQEIIPEGSPVGILVSAEASFAADKTNEEVLADLLEEFPERKLSLTGVAARRVTLRKRGAPIASDEDVRKKRGLPRSQTAGAKAAADGIGDFIKQRIRRGNPDADVLSQVAAKFPQARTTIESVRWYRSTMRKTEPTIPTNVQAKRAKDLVSQ